MRHPTRADEEPRRERTPHSDVMLETLNHPHDIVVDDSDSVYVTGYARYNASKITPDGVITESLACVSGGPERQGRFDVSQIVAIAISFVLCATAVGDQLAVPGERAPDLEGVRWIHREPVERFETGRVYVIEFWSTWCAACIESIDALNELAHRYEADATFIAIHIWQRDSAPKPAAFLAGRLNSEKPIMAFSVAEDVDDTLAKTWMNATGNGGLPTAMIVDRTSRLTWFGHSKELDEPLKAIVERTFDTRRRVAEMNRRIRVGRKATESGKAIEQRQYERGMTLILDALREDPGTVAEWIPSTYGHLLATSRSPAIAKTFARRVLAIDEGNNADVLSGIARAIVYFRPEELRDLNLALVLADKANAISNSKNPHTLSTLAMVRAELNDVVGAIKAIELAIRNADDEDERARLVKTLEDIRKRQRH